MEAPGTEWCFYVEAEGSLDAQELAVLDYALSETFEPRQFGPESFLEGRFSTIIEFGPRLSFETAWSSNAVEICRRSGARSVRRLERSVRLGFAEPLSGEEIDEILAPLHDRMTEMRYAEPLTSFETGISPEPVRRIPLLARGSAALAEFDRAYGCSWDSSDLELIAGIFRRLERDPTDVELFQIAQANSEHSRHWVFKGELWVDGERVPEKNLMEIVKQPLATSGPNSVIAFRDDSSAIHGTQVRLFAASAPLGPSPLVRMPTPPSCRISATMVEATSSKAALRMRGASSTMVTGTPRWRSASAALMPIMPPPTTSARCSPCPSRYRASRVASFWRVKVKHLSC